mgnify:FL=1
MPIKINPVKTINSAKQGITKKVVKGASGLPLEEPLTSYKDQRLAEMLDPSAPMQNALRKIETATQIITSKFKK